MYSQFIMRELNHLMLLLSIISTVTTGIQEKKQNDSHSQLNHVNHFKPCSLMEFKSKAQCLAEHHRLICKRGFASDWLKGQRSNINYLRILEWPGECFNVSKLQHFPELRILEFHNCTALKTFKGHSTGSKIEKLSIHGSTSLWEVPAEVVAQMTELKEIDFRSNGLRHIRARILKGLPKLQRIYLSDNKWDCSDGGLDWLALERDNSSLKRKIVDYFQLTCHQQLYRGKPLHKVMDIIRTVRHTCPLPCHCAMTHVVSDAAGNIIPLITVDCSHQGLETPPATLPPSTTTLRLEGNKINTIRSIIQNPHYRKLADLYLDNNSISAVKELEGSEWFASFRVLSLRGNLMKDIPIYAFDKAFQVNNNLMNVFLGHNPWRCDCHFIPRFQGLLRKYQRVIRDLDDVRCAGADDKLSRVQISSMPLGDVCSNSTGIEMPLSRIDVVNLVLASLIFLVIGRFLYDWHAFKTTGKLPWISSILP